LLEGGGTTRDSVLCEYMTNDRTRKAKCVRTGRYKYVFAGADGQHEFYDLQEDPDELCNLYGDPRYASEVALHKDLLLDRLMHSEQFYYRDETPSDRDLKIWLS
jgi:arylsulfatase A-like enzyme